jgi:MarR family transcriptional regulator for hemolysin
MQFRGGQKMESIIRSINHIARLATLYRERELKKYGLGPMHHTYILNICRNPGISQEALSQLIFVNKSNVTRQLAVLEEKGYLRRQTSSVDARCLLVYPTEKALAIQPVISEMLQRWNDQVLAGFSEIEQQELLANLEILKENSQQLLKKEKENQ